MYCYLTTTKNTKLVIDILMSLVAKQRSVSSVDTSLRAIDLLLFVSDNVLDNKQFMTKAGTARTLLDSVKVILG